MKRIRFFLLLGVVALGVLVLIACPTDNGAAAAAGGGSISITVLAAEQQWTSGIMAFFLPNGSGGIPSNATVIGANMSSAPGILIYFVGTAAATYDVTAAGDAAVTYSNAGGQSYIANANNGSGTVTVTSYGVVGELIVGTFDVQVDIWNQTNPDPDLWGPSGTLTTATGSFSVTRQADTP